MVEWYHDTQRSVGSGGGFYESITHVTNCACIYMWYDLKRHMSKHRRVLKVGKSYRKTPIFKIAGDSDKSSKKQCNKKLRGATREALKHYDPNGDEDLIIPEQEEVMDVWTFNSDGKKYIHSEVEHKQRWERPADKRDIDHDMA